MADILDGNTRLVATLAALVNRIGAKYAIHGDNLRECLAEATATVSAMEQAALSGDHGAATALIELVKGLSEFVGSVDGKRVAEIIREKGLLVDRSEAH